MERRAAFERGSRMRVVGTCDGAAPEPGAVRLLPALTVRAGPERPWLRQH